MLNMVLGYKIDEFLLIFGYYKYISTLMYANGESEFENM